jgi:putative metalloprotease
MLKFTPILLAILYALAMFQFSSWRTRRELDEKSTELADATLKTLTDRMAAALGLERIRVNLYEVDVVNGLAAPDGRIFLTRGFYEKYRRGEVTAEELSSVIAHELGHVALGHTRRRMIDFSGQNAIRVALATVLGRFIPGLGVWIANMLTTLLAARLSRQDEYEADAYASALLVKSGIGTGPQKSLFAKLEGLTGPGRARRPRLADEPPQDRRAHRRDRGAGKPLVAGIAARLAAQRPAQPRQPRALQEVPQRQGGARQALRLPVHAPHDAFHRIRRLGHEVQEERIGMHGGEAEGREFPAREIAQVHGDDAVRARGPRGGQHVDVGGIGQPQGRLPGRIVARVGPGEARREARDLAARERGVPRSALPLRRARPFLQKPRRPGRHEQPRLGAACQELAQDRGIEHAGIQDPDRPPAHGINRKASALRYPVSVSAGCCGWSGPANPVWISRGSRPPRPSPRRQAARNLPRSAA